MGSEKNLQRNAPQTRGAKKQKPGSDKSASRPARLSKISQLPKNPKKVIEILDHRVAENRLLRVLFYVVLAFFPAVAAAYIVNWLRKKKAKE